MQSFFVCNFVMSLSARNEFIYSFLNSRDCFLICIMWLGELLNFIDSKLWNSYAWIVISPTRARIRSHGYFLVRNWFYLQCVVNCIIAMSPNGKLKEVNMKKKPKPILHNKLKTPPETKLCSLKLICLFLLRDLIK